MCKGLQDNDRWSTDITYTHGLDNEKGKKERQRKQEEILSIGEEGKPKLNSSLNSRLCSGGEQHKKSAANRPNYFSILPMFVYVYAYNVHT